MNTSREHLDAETVAAWIDGGLDAVSLAAAEAHASNCDRCQALLATVTRTLPAEGAASGTEPAGTFRLWKWLAPLGATAAAITLWMVVPQDPMRPPTSAAPQSDAATAPAPAAPSASEMQPAPSAAAASAETAKRAAPPAADARFAESRRDAAGKDAEAKATLADAQSGNAAASELRERQEKREANLERAAPAPPAAPAAAPAEPARNTAAAGAALGAVTQLRKQIATLEFVSPDPQRRWRVAADVIEHSVDGGRTWIPVRLNAGDLVSAGASPAPQICWLVGRQGLVLLATDGTNFTRLPFPEPIDLAAISAVDARRATVTAADGRTFTTDDNGRTWRNP